MSPCSHASCCTPGRYATIHVGSCDAIQGLVAVKVYDEVARTCKRRRMAMREAMLLKFLNSQG